LFTHLEEEEEKEQVMDWMGMGNREKEEMKNLDSSSKVLFSQSHPNPATINSKVKPIILKFILRQTY